MRTRSFSKAFVLGLTIVGLAGPSGVRADTVPVAAGYDLFQTDPSGTAFDFGGSYGTQSLMGIPLGTFNFGSGLVGTGMTDTIVQRTQAVLTSGGSTPLQMLALQLESVNAVDLSGDHLFVLLSQSPPTTDPNANKGTMIIDSGSPGTFSSTLDIYFNVYLGTTLAGAVGSGPIAGGTNVNVQLSSSDTPWSHTAPPGAELIKGVNYLLDPNGSTDQDFWPSAVHNGPHLVDPAMTPEPSTWIMLAAAVVMVPAYDRWRRRRA